MGLFGFGKKKEVQNQESGFDTQSNNLGLDLSEHKDPMMDVNSGLKLGELQDEPQQFDSFGNPKSNRQSSALPQFDSSQNLSSQGSSDISKDLQIIMAKLDAVRSELNSLHHEIESLKRQQPQQEQKKYPW